MGLDIVELVMEIEEAFDISIPEDRASRMLTVGDIYEFILEKTANASFNSQACLTAATFYELRRRLRLLGLTKSEIRPGTKLDDAIPLAWRRSSWRTLAMQMDLRFPRLARPSWLSLLNCMLVSISIFASFHSFAKQNLFSGIIVASGVGITATALVIELTKPFAVYPYSTCSTIRDLVTILVALNCTKLSVRYSTQNPAEIWNALQLIVAEQLGVEQSTVVPHARFVQDLGAN